MQRFYLEDVQVAELSGNPWYGMCEKTPLSKLRLPSRRPFLYFTEEELQALKGMIETQGWAKQNSESIVTQADDWVNRGSYEVPEEVRPTVGRVRAVSHHLPKPLAMAYALTGDLRYAQKAREALLYLSDLRPEGGMGRRTGDYGYTCGYAMAGFSLIYDLVYESGVFSGEDREKIENTMRAGFQGMKLSSGNMKFHNRAAVCLGGMAAIAFCLQDMEMIDWVLAGAYGFHRHMASVPEDGLWEEGPSYAYMTFGNMSHCAGYMGVAECAYHAGINLYEDPNLQKLLLTPITYAFPDMTLSGHGHAGAGDSIVDRVFAYVRPYLRTGDPRVRVGPARGLRGQGEGSIGEFPQPVGGGGLLMFPNRWISLPLSLRCTSRTGDR